MPFWDILEDPYDWLKNQASREKIAGSPIPVRGRLSGGYGYGREDKNPFDVLSSVLESRFNPDPNRIYGHFNRSQGNRFRDAQRGLLNTRVRQAVDEALAPPSTAEILAQLQALQDPSRYMQDQGSLAQQAMELVSSQYDPAIAQLEQQMASAQTRAARNKTELGNMFNTLSTNLQGDIPAIEQMYTQDKAESKAGYDQLQQQTTDQYAKSEADQQAMLQRLNVQAAAPDVLAAQERDKNYFTQLAAQNAATEQSALGTEERGAVNYTRQGSEIARAEGVQRQADLMAQLEDVLAQYGSQIGAQRAAKNNAYLSALGQLTSDSQDSAYSRAQRDFENYISMIQLGRALNKDSSGSNVTTVKSPADVAGRALGLGLSQADAQNVQDVFMSAISSDPQILSGTGVFGTAASKEAMAKRVIEAGRQAGLSQAELNILQTAALEYFGRR